MRFQINVDCTPEEARQFFGLPDIMPMQQELMDMITERLSENIRSMEPDKLVQTWLPAMFQGWSDMQTHFWGQMTNMGGKMGAGLNPMNFNMSPSSKRKSEEDGEDDDEPSSSRSSSTARKKK